jgi:hypothetical protein
MIGAVIYLAIIGIALFCGTMVIGGEHEDYIKRHIIDRD